MSLQAQPTRRHDDLCWPANKVFKNDIYFKTLCDVHVGPIIDNIKKYHALGIANDAKQHTYKKNKHFFNS